MGHHPPKSRLLCLSCRPTPPNTIRTDARNTRDRCVWTASASGFRGEHVLFKSDAFSGAHAAAPAHSCADPLERKYPISSKWMWHAEEAPFPPLWVTAARRQEPETWADLRGNLKKEGFHGQILIYVRGRDDGRASNERIMKSKPSTLHWLLSESLTSLEDSNDTGWFNLIFVFLQWRKKKTKKHQTLKNPEML